MYEQLTNFIPKSNDLKVEGEFLSVVYDFVDANPDLNLKNYKAILAENDIRSFNVDVSSLGGKIVAALIVAIIRTDRFHEGLLQRSLKTGRITKYLLRLKEIDEDAK